MSKLRDDVMEREERAVRDGGQLTPAIECVTGEGHVEPVRADGGEVQPIRAAALQVDELRAEEMRAEPLRAEPIRVARPAEERGEPRLGEASLQEIYRELLLRVGEDPERDGLRRTPERMEKSAAFLTRGYGQSLQAVLGGALFDVDYDEMVIVRDIEFYSQCEHHMLPFYGKAHVAYIPQGKVIGLSKLPRVVDMFARRLQVQERLTRQIAEAVIEAIHPQGVGVILEAQHLCMMMRGVEKQSSMTTTSAMLGVFRTQQQTRNEFLSLVRRPGATV